MLRKIRQIALTMIPKIKSEEVIYVNPNNRIINNLKYAQFQLKILFDGFKNQFLYKVAILFPICCHELLHKFFMTNSPELNVPS